jgi:hypothetical protein
MNKIIILIACFFCSLQLDAQQVISLAGAWTVKLDPQKTGEQQQWYKKTFEQKIQLPGTLDDAGIGEPSTLSTDSLYREVLLHLTRKHSYVGYAWYAKQVTIPASWKGKSIELFLERVIWNTKVWIDGREIGSQESLISPQKWVAGKYLKPGKHLIVLRIDNSKQYDMSYRDMAHSYTNETQIMWNGVIGKLQLTARDPAHIENLQAYASIKDRSVSVDIALQNDHQQSLSRNLLVQVWDGKNKLVAKKSVKVQLPPGVQTKQVKLDVAAPMLWDEFNPNVYTLKAELINGASKDSRSVSFAFRELGNDQSLLQINGRRLFIRGTLECNIFPLTGHPPMEKAGWIKVFSAAKSYGLNHLRFHSWCPPEAAFAVADSMGMYLQVELPFWNKNAGEDTAMDRWLEQEANRISDTYGNHPSLCFWSMGNELQGDFNWLSAMVTKLKKKDPRHLYTTTTFSFQQDHGRWPEPVDDYYITQYTKKGWVRGQGIFNSIPPDFKTDYTKAIEGLPAPIITHEIGQYSVYPDMKEIAKYTGVLDPLNFKAIQKDLRKKGMLSLAPSFTLASGKFAANLYKEEIERALKTRGGSGFQLLDLHDFPGQGTALVGILNAFWDSKGLVTPAEHRQYCAPVVPLLRFEKASWTNDETFEGVVEVANFSNRKFQQIKPIWTIKDDAGKIVAQGVLPPANIDFGNGIVLDSFTVDLSKIKKASALHIEVALAGTAYKNSWTIWVYPKQLPNNTGNVVFTNSLAEALAALDEGKNVLCNPDTAVLSGVQGRFAPVFWSPVHFPNQPGTMGLLCDPQHPALKNFPTEFYSNWQWWDLVTSSKTMIIDSLPAMEPIVRVIDNFLKNRKMADVIEARVGRGKLVLVSADITKDLDQRPAARQLRYSLLEYMNGAAFNPKVTLTKDQLQYLFNQ